jgi:shikimate dehydrogenase
VAYALASAGVPVRIWARRPEQAEQLIADLRPHLTDDFLIFNLQPSIPNINYQLSKIKLIINCTPVGMTPHVGASPWPDDLPFHSGQFLYDLVYNPPETKLMRQARAGGAGVSNGLGMLLHQGALAWEQWTGVSAPLAAMRRALEGGGD